MHSTSLFLLSLLFFSSSPLFSSLFNRLARTLKFDAALAPARARTRSPLLRPTALARREYLLEGRGRGNELVRVKYYACQSFSRSLSIPLPLAGGRVAFRDFQIEHCWRRHNEIGREPRKRRRQNTTTSSRRRFRRQRRR